MKRILLDSGVLSDFVNRRRGIPDKIRGYASQGIRVGTCVPVLAEIVAGIECSQSRDRNMKALMASIKPMKIWPFDELAAFRFGEIFAELKKQGRPMQVVDIMVASIAVNLGSCLVATTDSDLKAISGIDVEIW
ncbi:MAG: type II toxin-antitoxin system VapC family toxin [Pirellula sp.]|nr:type II toxin-antitoxin system VapC family toxin [Pirellula sp.]